MTGWLMKFLELSEQAKLTAVESYISGWLETHPNEKYSFDEAKSLCIDDEDCNYDVNGNVTE